MSNKRGRHTKRRGRTTEATRPLHLVPKPWELPPPTPTPRPPSEFFLSNATLRALAADRPLDLLALVSAVLWAVRSPGPNGQRERPSEAELIEAWSDGDDRVTTAWLVGAAVLAHDAAAREAAAAEVDRRSHRLPEWAAGLAEVSVTRAVEVTHALGDGDAVLLELATPGARSLTVELYVDHILGTIVTHAFVMPEPIDGVLEQMADLLADPHATLSELDPATARARVSDALDNPLSNHAFGDPLAPWPRCRPIVEWMLRLLPPGGTGYRRHEWSTADRAALATRFFESPYGRALRDWRREHLLGEVLDLLDDGDTDLMRWSPATVEILLADRLPDGDWFGADDLTSVPDLLRAFIGYCHHERGIPADLTETTLTSVDRCMPAIDRVINDLCSWDDDDPWSWEEMQRRELRRELIGEVGSELALRMLDAEPLPDEAFDWQAVPVSDHPRLRAIVEIVDATCDALFDRELRTAARRLILRVALGDPAVLRRGRADTTAAALVWIVATPNRAFRRSNLLVKELMAHLGLSSGSPAQRAEPMLAAAGIDTLRYPHLMLGDPKLLTSAQRQWIIERRDQCNLAPPSIR